MALFPQSFIDDLRGPGGHRLGHFRGRAAAQGRRGVEGPVSVPPGEDAVVQRQRRQRHSSSASAAALGGDVFKFVELQHKVSFPEAVRLLAARAGMALPETEGGPADRAAAAERDSLIRLHEQALAFFRAQLEAESGQRARRELDTRGLDRRDDQRPSAMATPRRAAARR